jgi:hypothetical protein
MLGQAPRHSQRKAMMQTETLSGGKLAAPSLAQLADKNAETAMLHLRTPVHR